MFSSHDPYNLISSVYFLQLTQLLDGYAPDPVEMVVEGNKVRENEHRMLGV